MMKEFDQYIESLLFEKNYNQLSQKEKELVDQSMGALAYKEMRSVILSSRIDSANPPAYLEDKLITAYRSKYKATSWPLSAKLAIAASLFLGVLLGAAIWSVWSPKPEIVAYTEFIRDTIYLEPEIDSVPLAVVSKEASIDRRQSSKERAQFTVVNTSPIKGTESPIPPGQSPLTNLPSPITSHQSPLTNQAMPTTHKNQGRNAKADSELMDMFVEM